MQEKSVFLDAQKAYCASQSGYCKWQQSCVSYVEMNFISAQGITEPKHNLVIIICHTIMCGSYLPKDSVFLLLPLAVVSRVFLVVMQKTFQTKKLMTAEITAIYAFCSPKPLKHR